MSLLFAMLVYIYIFRFACQLLTPCRVLAETNGRDTINKDDVEEINGLFADAKQSSKHLHEYSEKYLKWVVYSILCI